MIRSKKSEEWLEKMGFSKLIISSTDEHSSEEIFSKILLENKKKSAVYGAVSSRRSAFVNYNSTITFYIRDQSIISWTLMKYPSIKIKNG